MKFELKVQIHNSISYRISLVVTLRKRMWSFAGGGPETGEKWEENGSGSDNKHLSFGGRTLNR